MGDISGQDCGTAKGLGAADFFEGDDEAAVMIFVIAVQETERIVRSGAEIALATFVSIEFEAQSTFRMVISEGHAFDENGFGAGGGPVFLNQVVSNTAKVVTGFAGAADIFRAEAVFERVPVTFLFPFGSFWTGRVLRVVLIRGDLRFRSHTTGR